jgi:hypothetical protein
VTSREAKRIALKNIVDGISSELANGAEYWAQHPETREPLEDDAIALVEKAAREILVVLDRRASRLRSVRVG